MHRLRTFENPNDGPSAFTYNNQECKANHVDSQYHTCGF